MAKRPDAPQRPDIVLMDVTMPDLNGIEATRQIRAIEQAAGVKNALPILALTANAHRDDRDACLECGMSGFLSKPFDHADLEDVIEELTGSEDAA